jgi:hypothetical protein
MSDCALASDEHSHLPVEFPGNRGKVSAEFHRYHLAVDASPVNLLKRTDLAALETGQFSVKCRDLEPLRIIIKHSFIVAYEQ